MVLHEGEDHARTICKFCNWKKHSLKTVGDGERPSRSHHPTHASMERTINEEEEEEHDKNILTYTQSLSTHFNMKSQSKILDML